MKCNVGQEKGDCFTCSRKEVFAENPKLLLLLATKLSAFLLWEKYQVYQKASHD